MISGYVEEKLLVVLVLMLKQTSSSNCSSLSSEVPRTKTLQTAKFNDRIHSAEVIILSLMSDLFRRGSTE